MPADGSALSLLPYILKFSDLVAWVIGDSILDVYVHGRVQRVSPEGPIPVVLFTSQETRLGGAANIAANCARLGAATSLFSVVGADADGQELARLADQAGIQLQCIADPTRPTTTKTRILSEDAQVLRLDRETVTAVPRDVEDRLLDSLRSAAPPDVIVVADYAKGCITERTMAALRALSPHPLIVVDPKRLDLDFYRGCDFVKPNRAEAARAVGCEPSALFDEPHVSSLSKSIAGAGILVTCGAEGMMVIEADGPTTLVETVTRRFRDVTGAGDTAGAAFGLALAAGAVPVVAARIANAAAAITVGELGTHSVSQSELWLSIRESLDLGEYKLVGLDAAERLSAALRRDGRRVVFTNGCFDLLHAGHVHLLNAARRLGDHVFVGLNSDSSIRRLKGVDRPIFPLDERASMLSALAGVDAIIAFDADTPEELIARLHPDVLVKGAEYAVERMVGADMVEAWGGRVERVPMLAGKSTTGLLEALQKLQQVRLSAA
jgi:D-beta-D-heptose 7-phosphate kinase/D-beta-D-heptose 1-phosphate adenosyltransferase